MFEQVRNFEIARNLKKCLNNFGTSNFCKIGHQALFWCHGQTISGGIFWVSLLLANSPESQSISPDSTHVCTFTTHINMKIRRQLYIPIVSKFCVSYQSPVDFDKELILFESPDIFAVLKSQNYEIFWIHFSKWTSKW